MAKRPALIQQTYDTERSEYSKACDRIEEANAALTRAEFALIDAVDEARKIGTAWSSIGRALDITKQAAQQRFGA